jgi:hypothetical protein
MFEIRIVNVCCLPPAKWVFCRIEMAFYSANRMSIELKKKQGEPVVKYWISSLITRLFSRHYAESASMFFLYSSGYK